MTFPAYADARVSGVRAAIDLPSLLAARATGAGESSVSDGSGDHAEPEFSGMTPNRRERAIALAHLRKVQ